MRINGARPTEPARGPGGSGIWGVTRRTCRPCNQRIGPGNISHRESFHSPIQIPIRCTQVSGHSRLGSPRPADDRRQSRTVFAMSQHTQGVERWVVVVELLFQPRGRSELPRCHARYQAPSAGIRVAIPSSSPKNLCGRLGASCRVPGRIGVSVCASAQNMWLSKPRIY